MYINLYSIHFLTDKTSNLHNLNKILMQKKEMVEWEMDHKIQK